MTKYVKEQLNELIARLDRVMSSAYEEEKILEEKLEKCRNDFNRYAEDRQLIRKLLQTVDILEDINKNKPV